MARPIKAAFAAAAVAMTLMLGGCGGNPFTTSSWSVRQSHSERDCLARAMYFESNRSSHEGMKAVGTVVMNRLQSGRYPKTVCGVVGQQNQFADGVLSKSVSGSSWALAQRTADEVLSGERHARVGSAMFFHTAGYTFPYRNMAYVVAAGGNVFYEKKQPGSFTPIHPNILVAQSNRPTTSTPIMLARAEETPRIARAPTRTQVAKLEDEEEPVAPRRARTRTADEDEPAPRNGAARARLAGLDKSRHAGAERSRMAERDEDRRKPASKADRIRLASLDDDAMPKALRSRSDADRSAKPALPSRPLVGRHDEPKSTKPLPTKAVPQLSKQVEPREAKAKLASVALPYKAAKPAGDKERDPKKRL